MKIELLALYRRMQELQMDLHSAMGEIPTAVPSETVPDLIDSGFLCRELANMADDIRKTAENRQFIISKFIAARASVAQMQGEAISLHGELATATPDVRVKPKLPDTGTPEYHQLMRWIGLSDELIQRDMLRPSFTRIQEVLTARAVAGEKPPPGILVTYTDALVVFRRKKTNG